MSDDRPSSLLPELSHRLRDASTCAASLDTGATLKFTQCSSLDEIIDLLTQHAANLAALCNCQSVPTEFAYTHFGSRNAEQWRCYIWCNDDGSFAKAVFELLSLHFMWIHDSGGRHHGADAYVYLTKTEWPMMMMLERLAV